MADLTTYAGMQDAILRWLRRTNDTFTADDVPAFISLFEERANHDLRVRQMQVVDDAVSIAAETLALPTGWLESTVLAITVSGKTAGLAIKSDEQLWADYPDTATGTPAACAVIGSSFYIRPIPGSAFTGRHVYYQKVPALSAGVNWLLTDYPSLYLYGSLLETAPYLKNSAQIQIWADLYQRALGKIGATDESARWGGTQLAITADVSA